MCTFTIASLKAYLHVYQVLTKKNCSGEDPTNFVAITKEGHYRPPLKLHLPTESNLSTYFCGTTGNMRVIQSCERKLGGCEAKSEINATFTAQNYCSAYL